MYQDALQIHGMQGCTGCQLIFFTDVVGQEIGGKVGVEAAIDLEFVHCSDVGVVGGSDGVFLLGTGSLASVFFLFLLKSLTEADCILVNSSVMTSLVRLSLALHSWIDLAGPPTGTSIS